jgi:hypothetical protein
MTGSPAVLDVAWPKATLAVEIATTNPVLTANRNGFTACSPNVCMRSRFTMIGAHNVRTSEYNHRFQSKSTAGNFMTYKDLLMTPVTSTDVSTGNVRFRSCDLVNRLAAIQCKVLPMT